MESFRDAIKILQEGRVLWSAVQSISTHNSQRLPLSDSQSHRGNPLYLEGELQHSGAPQGGLWVSPHPPGASHSQQQKDRVQPVLCVEVSPTISSGYFSTSRISSGSLATRNVTFHFRTSLRCLKSAHLGLLFCLPPSRHQVSIRSSQIHSGIAHNIKQTLDPTGTQLTVWNVKVFTSTSESLNPRLDPFLLFESNFRLFKKKC